MANLFKYSSGRASARAPSRAPRGGSGRVGVQLANVEIGRQVEGLGSELMQIALNEIASKEFTEYKSRETQVAIAYQDELRKNPDYSDIDGSLWLKTVDSMEAGTKGKPTSRRASQAIDESWTKMRDSGLLTARANGYKAHRRKLEVGYDSRVGEMASEPTEHADDAMGEGLLVSGVKNDWKEIDDMKMPELWKEKAKTTVARARTQHYLIDIAQTTGDASFINQDNANRILERVYGRELEEGESFNRGDIGAIKKVHDDQVNRVRADVKYEQDKRARAKYDQWWVDIKKHAFAGDINTIIDDPDLPTEEKRILSNLYEATYVKVTDAGEMTPSEKLDVYRDIDDAIDNNDAVRASEILNKNADRPGFGEVDAERYYEKIRKMGISEDESDTALKDTLGAVDDLWRVEEKAIKESFKGKWTESNKKKYNETAMNFVRLRQDIEKLRKKYPGDNDKFMKEAEVLMNIQKDKQAKNIVKKSGLWGLLSSGDAFRFMVGKGPKKSPKQQDLSQRTIEQPPGLESIWNKLNMEEKTSAVQAISSGANPKQLIAHYNKERGKK